MEQVKTTNSRLFITSLVESRDELDEKYERCYLCLQNLTSGLSEKDAHDALNNTVCKDMRNHEEISLGLLVTILTEPQNAAKSYRDLTLITRDGLGLVLVHLSQLIQERYSRLLDKVRQQLLWLVREMIKNAVTGVDGLCWNLMRHIAGGDVSPRNVALAEALLDIYSDNRVWLDKFPFLIASVVYAYLRLIEDHHGMLLSQLRQREVAFTVTLMREKFTECLIIGRDLLRLMQNVARIPEFEQLWKDILTNPKSLCPTFSGVLQLLQSRTSRRFLQSRLTPDMEKKIVFLTSQVRFGMHKRYQDWFQKQYFATSESQSLRCDLIRFIVGVIHPTNELLCSDIIPRWAVIGWLLTTCTSAVAASNAKLALFYDWLFYDPEKDNIMNIEPAILVMHHSMRSHPTVTATLLDFLCRIIPNFSPPLTEKVRNGIYTSLRQILEKRVLPSLFPLFDNPKLDRELRTMVRETFKEFCQPPILEGVDMPPASLHPVKMEDFTGQVARNSPPHLMSAMDGHPNHSSQNNHSGENEPAFSEDDDDDDDDIPLAKVRLKEKSSNLDVKQEESEINQLLDGELRAAVEELLFEKDNEVKCQAMEKLVQLIIQDEIDSDVASALGQALCSVLKEQLEGKVFPPEVNDESIEDSIGRPLFVMLRNLLQIPEDDPNRRPILLVLAEMYSNEPRVGYLLLYFLKACKLNDGKASVYKDFCQALDKDLESCLVSDLKLCQEDDMSLFCWLVPEVYSQFPSVALGQAELLQLVVSAVDARQLQDLVCHILQGRLVMFRSDSFLAALSASLTWETFEQFCLWQLVAAHSIPLEYVLPLLPRLRFAAHAEALTSILLLLKKEKPTVEILKQLLAREVRSEDVFVVSALKYWSQEHEDMLGGLISGLLVRHSATSPPNKRKRGNPGNKGGSASASATSGPPPEKVLAHLDQLRQCCRQSHFFSLDSIQRALNRAQSACTETQKKRFSDLFALAEVEEPPPVETKSSSGKGSGGGRGRRAGGGHSGSGKGAKSRVVKEVSESSDDTSEGEGIVKPKQAKKRKKANPVASDSD
ncbi:integrator complex subunit 3 [Hetaerina americana]|uniref:integrator complex subunit 3 n=1 Tax=Hetaerina americana TaxID=62018 RepID=UPI003A7F1205